MKKAETKRLFSRESLYYLTGSAGCQEIGFFKVPFKVGWLTVPFTQFQHETKWRRFCKKICVAASWTKLFAFYLLHFTITSLFLPLVR